LSITPKNVLGENDVRYSNAVNWSWKFIVTAVALLVVAHITCQLYIQER